MEKIRCYLLIVPYGIETMSNEYNQQMLELLIVPYGIETVTINDIQVLHNPFNRTLWN